MQKQMKNGIIFVVFLLLCFLLTVTPLITEQALFLSDEAKEATFDGLIFDDPSRVEHLQVTRRLEEKEPLTYRYDVRFRYEGDPSSVRILGKPAGHVFMNEGAVAKKSKAELKGEYDKVASAAVESLKLKNILEKIDFQLKPVSEIRVPLDEDTEDYHFSITDNPVTIRLKTAKSLADVGVFITNGKVDNFTDGLDVKDGAVRPETTTKTQSGVYVNALEMINGSLLSRVKAVRIVATVAATLSVLGGLYIILTDKQAIYPAVYAAMVVFLLSLPAALAKAPNNWAIFLVMPLMGFLGYLLFKLMGRVPLRFRSVDFRQASGMAIVVFILSTYLFAVSKGFYL